MGDINLKGESIVKVVESCISLSKWRLKPSSKRRLLTDILALCTRMRAVVMVDYGGKMPELQQRLCLLLNLMQKETPLFQCLRVVVIEDMIYLIHVEGIAKFASSCLNSDRQLLLVDLEQNPPKMITQSARNPLVTQLVSIQKLFSLLFLVDGTNSRYMPCEQTDLISRDEISGTDDMLLNSQSSVFIDLSHCIQGTQVTMPTLNGWLLGYPIVYLLSEEHATTAIHNLSTKSLHLFKVLVSRSCSSGKGDQEEELMSFSVPCNLSLEGSGEQWAQVFEAQMREKWENCKQIWKSLRIEISVCHPQEATIVL